MPTPIRCLDDHLRHFVQRCRKFLSKPHCQYFVIVLLGLMLCEGRRTLLGVVRQIADGTSLAGLSRFLLEAPWEATALAEEWQRHFRETMQPHVAADLQRQRMAHPKRRERPRQPVGSSVSDRGRLDDAQTLREANGGIGAASFDDPGQAASRSQHGREFVCAALASLSFGSAAVSVAGGVRSGRSAVWKPDPS